MKKSLLILFVLIVLSGCSITRVDTYDYKQMLDKIVSLNMNIYNNVGNGYKYYAPKGIVRLSSKDYNDVLKRNDNIYYLFVDVVGYYYKTKIDYDVNNNVYYSKVFDKENKYGFIDIQEKNNKLYIQMVYNYAKIETYVDKNNLKQAVTDIGYILSSIDFNDSLLNKMYEQGNLDSKEEVYKLFENKEKEGNFLEYVEQYDKYDEEQQNEQELIIESTTTTTSKITEKEQSSSNE